MAEYYFCEKCGTELLPRDEKCPNCGEKRKIDKSVEAYTSNTESEKEIYKMSIYFAKGTVYKLYFPTRKDIDNFEELIVNPEITKKNNGFIKAKDVAINVQNIEAYKIEKTTREKMQYESFFGKE